jgi:hypothetical protein
MKGYDCQAFVDRADKLWSIQSIELDGKYTGRFWMDGGFFFSHPLYGMADEDDVKLLLEHIREKIDLLNESAEIFKENMTSDKWKENISDNLTALPKEEIIQKFNTEYSKLLTGYEELCKQVEKLLKE